MTNVYIYEDSFINLLNLVDELLSNKIKPANIKNEKYLLTLRGYI